MTNYSLQKGIARNKKINKIKTIVLILLAIIGMTMLVKHWEVQDAKLMAIEYCWDSNGDHYVSPDPHCMDYGVDMGTGECDDCPF